ncbi:hypothetical protein ACHAWC_007645 [Mediolabrus comicus]
MPTSSAAASTSLQEYGAPILRRQSFVAFTHGAAALLVPRGGGLFDTTREREIGENVNSPSMRRSSNAKKSSHDEQHRWSTQVFTAIMASSIYVIYPVSMLMLFRISETISALRLFEHHHRCHQLGDKVNCAQLFAVHGSQFGAWLALAFCYRKRNELPCSFTTLLAALIAVSLGIYKGLVDGYLLFDPSSLDGNRTNLTGKIAVITGANRGIGLETSRTLASMGAHVIMTCRSLSKCQPLVDDINSDNKIAGSAAAAVLDLRSLVSAAMLASELREAYANIDYIFCNAGTTPQFELTEDGFEDAFGGMHLAHMLLVLGILPSLTNGSSDDNPSRVIMVSSEMAINTAIGVFSPHDPHLTELFSKSNLRGEITRGTGKLPESLPAYGRAKLSNILFALELNRRQMAANDEEEVGSNMRPLIAHAVHTGAVNTASSRRSIVHMFAEHRSFHPGLGWLVGNVYFPLLWRPVQGGARVLLCAALSQSREILRGGQYLDALCHPFLPVQEDNNKVLEAIQSGDAQEDTVHIQRWNATIYLDAIQALQLADARWSKIVFEMSLELLRENAATRSIVDEYELL